MKSINSSVLIVALVFANSFNNILNPTIETNSNYAIEPELQFYQETKTDYLSRFDYVDSIHDGLVTSYLDTLGVTRAFFNLYNDQYDLTHQYILNQDEYPKLDAIDIGAIVGYSNSIWLNDLIITYYQNDTPADQSSLHKLLIINVSDKASPDYLFVELTISGLDIIDSVNDLATYKLQFVDNNLYLTSVNENNSISIANITFDLDAQLNIRGYSIGTIVGLANSTTPIAQTTDNTSLDFCQIFDNQIYCLDRSQNNKLFNFNIFGLGTFQTIYFYNRYLLLYFSNTNTIKQYYVDKEFNNDQIVIGLKAFEVLSITITNANFEFPHLDVNNNNIVFFNLIDKYTINLDNYTFTNVSFLKNQQREVYYNEAGKRVLVYQDANLLYAVSDFENVVYVINTNGLIIKATNYYQDKLLILGFDPVLKKFSYLSYPIAPNSNNGTPILVYEFAEEDIIATLNHANNDSDPSSADFTYSTYNLDYLVAFKFYKDELYMIDIERLTNIVDEKYYLGIIKLTLPNLMRAYYFDANGFESIDFSTMQIRPGSQDARQILIKARFVIESDLVVGDLTLIAGNYVAATLSQSFIFATGQQDRVASYMSQGLVHELYLDVFNYQIRYDIDGVTYRSIKIPINALENLNNRYLGQLYSDFYTEFPYSLVNFYTDEHNNLFIQDTINNIYILYNPTLRVSEDVADIFIPGVGLLDNEASSFDLIVTNNVLSFQTTIRAYFNRIVVNNSSPYSLNEGINSINITLQSLDNSLKTITFNVFRALNLSSSPSIILPGLDPNYVSSSSGSSIISSSSAANQGSSAAISSQISSSFASNSVTSINSSSSSSASAKDYSIQDNSLFLWYLLGVPLVFTGGLIGIVLLAKTNRKPKKSRVNKSGKNPK